MGIGTSKGAFYETEFDLHIQPGTAMDNNELSPNEVMPNTPEPVDPSHYETPLTAEQEGKFQDWKSKMAPNDSGHDYDLRGAFLNNVTPDKETGHWPDTFKKPNHPTFSDQSMYAGERPDLAGRWQGDVYIPPLPITPIANTGPSGNVQVLRVPANDNKNLDLGTGGFDIDAAWAQLKKSLGAKPKLTIVPK